MDSYSDASQVNDFPKPIAVLFIGWVCVQAGKEFQRVRDNLVYKDEDVLETGMQKVQPLQYLGELYTLHYSRIKKG